VSGTGTRLEATGPRERDAGDRAGALVRDPESVGAERDVARGVADLDHPCDLGRRSGKGWERISRTVDPETYPRMAEIAPHAAKLGWDEIFWTGFELLIQGLESRL